MAGRHGQARVWPGAHGTQALGHARVPFLEPGPGRAGRAGQGQAPAGRAQPGLARHGPINTPRHLVLSTRVAVSKNIMVHL